MTRLKERDTQRLRFHRVIYTYIYIVIMSCDIRVKVYDVKSYVVRVVYVHR